MRITPKNWAEFQHYKDRDPPWIKLHKKLLDDYEFQGLPLASRALAPMLWLLASEDKGGVIDASEQKLAFRLRISVGELTDALMPLIQANFFSVVRDASDTLAPRKRAAMPETEAERETEAETQVQAEADSCAAPTALAPPVVELPTNRFGSARQVVGFSQAQLDDYAQTFPAVDVLQQFREMRRWLVDNPERRKTAKGMGKFVNGWLGKEQDKNHGNGQRRSTPHDAFAKGLYLAAGGTDGEAA